MISYKDIAYYRMCTCACACVCEDAGVRVCV